MEGIVSPNAKTLTSSNLIVFSSMLTDLAKPFLRFNRNWWSLPRTATTKWIHVWLCNEKKVNYCSTFSNCYLSHLCGLFRTNVNKQWKINIHIHAKITRLRNPREADQLQSKGWTGDYWEQHQPAVRTGFEPPCLLFFYRICYYSLIWCWFFGFVTLNSGSYKCSWNFPECRVTGKLLNLFIVNFGLLCSRLKCRYNNTILFSL